MVSLLMQNTQKLSQLINEIGFNAFSLEGYQSMQCAVNSSRQFANLCNVINDQAEATGLAMSQFVVIDGGSKNQVALFWLVDSEDTREKYSNVVWFMNFKDEDWSALRGRCAEFATSVDGAMEVSEAIENMFAWTERDKI